MKPRDLPALVSTRVRRRVAPRLRPRAGVLLYHRVAEPPIDTWQLSVSPATFERQIAHLASEWHPMPLDALLDAARAGRMPDKAVAVTFDDGYVDNLEVAVPILERHGVPATIYVATGYIGEKGLYWWDELEQLLMGDAVSRPDRIDLTVAGTHVEASMASRSDRAAVLTLIQGLMRRGPADALETTLRDLREWTGQEPNKAMEIPGTRAVSVEELLLLASSPAIDIGAHSRTHPGLATQPSSMVRDEIEGSRDDLLTWLGSLPLSFSYPLGDQRPTTRRLVRAAGFESAVAVLETPVTRLTNRWEVPRIMAIEGPDELFEGRLEALIS